MRKMVLPVIVVMVAALLGVASLSGAAEMLKPYVLGSSAEGTIAETLPQVKEALAGKGFTVAGEYAPYDGAHIIVVTSDALKSNAAKTALGAYGAVQRVALTAVGDKVQVSYTNPPYLAHAYRMGGDLQDVAEALASALGREREFGSEKGLTAKDLEHYHYMMFMPYFDDQVDLRGFGSYDEAVKAVEEGLAAGRGGTAKVYRVDVPGKEETVFGVAMKEGDGADADVMKTVDFGDPKQTAHLPYEMVVSGKKVRMLHGKFRIAVQFPDLTMGTFMKISAAPGAIEDALGAVVKKD